jgi:hypothetical protein
VDRLFGRPGTSPTAFARIRLDGARAIRVGPTGAGERLFQPVMEHLRADAAVIGAAQMSVAAESMSKGLDRRTGADVFHRRYLAEIDAMVAEHMAIAAADLVGDQHAGPVALLLAQHWIRTRFGTIVPDASAIMHLADMPVPPAVVWTSPLLPLWGGTGPVLRTEFRRLDGSGQLGDYLLGQSFQTGSHVLERVRQWLLEIQQDAAASVEERLEAAALVWAASIMSNQGRIDALGVILGGDEAPRRRSTRSASDRNVKGGTAGAVTASSGAGDDESEDDDVVIDLRETESVSAQS